MRAITGSEAGEWCSHYSLVDVEEALLEFSDSEEYSFFVPLPEAFLDIQRLAREIVAFDDYEHFSGGLLWLRAWDFGYFETVAWRAIELWRQSRGEMRPIEVAPVHVFRREEQLELQAFLLQIVGYGWIAEYVPVGGAFVLRFKSNSQMSVTARSEDTLRKLRSHFEKFNPTNEDPILVRMAQMKKERDEAMGKKSDGDFVPPSD